MSPALRAAYVEQLRVVHALLMREMLLRFGGNRLGLAYMFSEPFAVVGFIIAMRGIFGGFSPYGIEVIVFVATGALPFFYFRNCVSKLMACASAAKSLMVITEVKLLDTYVARILLESVIYLTMFAAVLATLHLLEYETAVPDDALRVLFGMTSAGALGFGIGLCCAAAQTVAPVVKGAISFILRVLLWISGVFFSITSVPMQYRWFLTWNPVFHLMEYIRAAHFAVYDAYDPDGIFYAWEWIAGSTLLGLVLIRRMRRRLLER
ncbi:MAG: ABC transporter permease [Rickettsiales bacterium]